MPSTELTPAEDSFAADHYEILRLGPEADEEAIERVYRTLADRFHPDNPSTGDPRIFLRIKEAYETLSNPSKRAQYNRRRTGGSYRFRLRGREFFDGIRGEQNRRLAALCLLYRQRISTHESPGLTLLDLEQLTACTREELGSALWYLCEKNGPGSGTAPSTVSPPTVLMSSRANWRNGWNSAPSRRYVITVAPLNWNFKALSRRNGASRW